MGQCSQTCLIDHHNSLRSGSNLAPRFTYTEGRKRIGSYRLQSVEFCICGWPEQKLAHGRFNFARSSGWFSDHPSLRLDRPRRSVRIISRTHQTFRPVQLHRPATWWSSTCTYGPFPSLKQLRQSQSIRIRRSLRLNSEEQDRNYL